MIKRRLSILYLVIFEAVIFLIFNTLIVSLLMYRFLYHHDILINFGFLLLVLLLGVLLAVASSRKMMFFLSFVASLALVRYASPSFDMLNTLRIHLSSPEKLPGDRQIVKWGGGGSFQSASFYYLAKAENLDQRLVTMLVRTDGSFAYLLNGTCSFKFHVLDSNYGLIESDCG